MRKLFIIIFVTLFLINLRANAQSDRPIFLGSSLNYSSEFESIALKINASIGLHPRIDLAPNISYYLQDPAGKIDRVTGLNLNGHFKFINESKFNLYGIVGGHVSKTEFDDTFTGSETETDFAINAGTGVSYDINNLQLFTEGKYMIESFNKYVFGLGLLYRIR